MRAVRYDLTYIFSGIGCLIGNTDGYIEIDRKSLLFPVVLFTGISV